MRQGPPLSLNPRACDRCGACVTACPRAAVRVGRTYLQVDWSRCDACGACVKACPRRAIVMRSPGASSRAASGGRTTAPRVEPTPRKRSGATQPASAAPRKRSAKAAADAGARVPKGGARGGFQWTLLEAAAMLSVTFSMFMVKEVISLSDWVAALEAPVQLPVRVLVLALYYAVQVGVIVWLVRRRGGEPLRALGIAHEHHSLGQAARSSGLVVVGLVVTRLLASLYAFVTRELGMLPESTTSLPALFGSGEAGFLVAVLMVVVIGPTVEELVFRGALQEGLAARFGVWPAIIVQAALFAAFHRSWWLLMPTFILGVALGWLAERCDSLWPPIALHALYNAITVVAAFLVSVPAA